MSAQHQDTKLSLGTREKGKARMTKVVVQASFLLMLAQISCSCSWALVLRDWRLHYPVKPLSTRLSVLKIDSPIKTKLSTPSRLWTRLVIQYRSLYGPRRTTPYLCSFSILSHQPRLSCLCGCLGLPLFPIYAHWLPTSNAFMREGGQ